MRILQRRTGRITLAVALSAASMSLAAADDPAPAIDAHLAAGEFGPAIRAAQQVELSAQRDALLDRVAAAQLAAGARAASLSTAGAMNDDRLRDAAARRVADRPIDVVGGFGGGMTEADFEPVENLITTTVAPATWETTGGPGSIKGFANGVLVDAKGVLRKGVSATAGGALSAVRVSAAERKSSTSVRMESKLRKVSLTRLEKHVQLALAAGREPTEAMQLVAGLRKVQFVLVYPETGDLVLAGPAGDWKTDAEGREISVEDGRPLLRLDDLVVLLRQSESGEAFGCSITPTQEGLAKIKAVADASAKNKLDPKRREAWLEKLRSSLGRQNITTFGVDPKTRVARTLVEADYRMKLVGLGLEEGVLGVRSYLALISVPDGGSPLATSVLRWWFTLNHDAVRTTPERDAFELRGQAVKLLSENQLLEASGKRVSTGDSETLNREFAESFTKHFAALATKYPVYADLENVCDLALVAAIVRRQNLAEQVNWRLTCFGKSGSYAPAQGSAPEEVDTVIAHRLIGTKHVLAAVSGGVRVDPWSFATPSKMSVDTYGKMTAGRTISGAKIKELPTDAWWWD